MSAAAEDMSAETAAEFLRLAIPKMARHKVPPDPLNYAIWYAYVSGGTPDLNAEVDRIIAEKGEFTPAVNAGLYRQYIAEHDANHLEQVRTNLKKIIGEVGSTLNVAGNGARAFEGTLGGFVEEVAQKNDLGEIRQLLETLVSETRTMQTTTSSIQTQFESRSREIEELHEQLQRERKRAITDPLTGLYNRLALFDRLNAAIGEAGEDANLSLVMLDIDHFKAVNDTHGHLIGDRVIRFVAQVLEKNVKGKDTAARYGGEEFTLLLPDTPASGAKAVAEVIRKAIAAAQLVRADNKKPLGQITISAGVASYQSGEDIMELINRADQALYRSKNDGRNRVSLA